MEVTLDNIKINMDNLDNLDNFLCGSAARQLQQPDVALIAQFAAAAGSIVSSSTIIVMSACSLLFAIPPQNYLGVYSRCCTLQEQA